MKEILIKPDVQIQKSAIHGYGGFATRIFSKGETIEECPIIKIPKKLAVSLGLYYFNWPAEDGDKDSLDYVMPLGMGAVYNHSLTANAGYSYDIQNQLLIFKALKDIDYLEEIFINYGKEWFQRKKITEEKFEGKKIFTKHDPLQIG